MQYVGRLVSSVYNNITPSINPATLSGAIDVIVVERQVEVEVDDDQDEQDGVGSSTPDNRNSNGNSNNKKKKKKKMVTELASTPFHVRFGKMSVLRPAERKVSCLIRWPLFQGRQESDHLWRTNAPCHDSFKRFVQ